jgi:5-methylcytosine-specific restriction endonuclease McrA
MRAAFVVEWLATKGPFCGLCGVMLEGGKATHVDHIRPFDGADDPLRLDWDNLRVLCAGCNSGKAGR